jgi:hypothetical protein
MDDFMNPHIMTGRWAGDYWQNGRPHPIRAELVQRGEHLTGTMQDVEPDRDQSVFDVAAEAGLQPGADEQIEAGLRAMFPDETDGPIRFVSHLPPASALEGTVKGSRVDLLKTYKGVHFGGYKIGNRLVGRTVESHSVHYNGRLSEDGLEFEGRWWIDPSPELGPLRVEGSFLLKRVRGG